MDASGRRLKEEELETWRRNLATLQGQAANFGTTPPIALVNEIETAQRNVKRVMAELDAGEAQSVDASLTALLELGLTSSRRIDDLVASMTGIEHQMRALQRRSAPSMTAVIIRWVSVLIIWMLYTSVVIKEFRDAILDNLLAASLIIALALLLAGLLRVLANLLQPVGVPNDDR